MLRQLRLWLHLRVLLRRHLLGHLLRHWLLPRIGHLLGHLLGITGLLVRVRLLASLLVWNALVGDSTTCFGVSQLQVCAVGLEIKNFLLAVGKGADNLLPLDDERTLAENLHVRTHHHEHAVLQPHHDWPLRGHGEPVAVNC